MVYMEGPIDFEYVAKFKESCLSSCNDGKVILNLGGALSIDSSGLGLLVAMLRRQESHKGKITLQDMPERIHHMLKTTYLMKLFKIEEPSA